MRRIRRRPEEDLQRGVVSFLLYVEPLALWTHVSNQKGTRTRAEMGILKAMGSRKGWSDLTFLMPAGAPVERGMIELKAEGGKLSEDQEEVRMECFTLGIPHEVCRSLSEVDAVLRLAWRVEYRRQADGLNLELGAAGIWLGRPP